MFKGATKADLLLVATELGEELAESLSLVDLKDLILNNKHYKKDPEFVTEITKTIIEERKSDKQHTIELEKLKIERVSTELELQKLKTESSLKRTETSEGEFVSIDSLLKSVQILTCKVPTKPENWGFFFNSLERAFTAKCVPDKFKAEILLNLLGEKANNILTYISDQEFNDYSKIKSIVLREYEPTPQICLDNFRKAQKYSNENYTQFASRMINSFDYYLKLRKVEDFASLKGLMVADKIFQTLDKDSAQFISIKQGSSFFTPVELGQQLDVYMSSKGRNACDGYSMGQKYKHNSYTPNKVLVADLKNKKCAFCESQLHEIYKCDKFLGLAVKERVDFVKKNKLCFRCLRYHLIKNCSSKYSCKTCQKNHNSLLCFKREDQSGVNSFVTNENQAVTSSLSADANEFVSTNQRNDNLFVGTNYNNSEQTVLLSTVLCWLQDRNGELHLARGILDNGSQCNLLSKEIADNLHLKRDKVDLVVSGLNDSGCQVKSSVTTKLINRAKTYEHELTFLIVPKIISCTPNKPIKINRMVLPNVQLADEGYNVPGRVDVLISAEVYYSLIKPQQIKIPNSNLILQNSVFGYIVAGSVCQSKTNKVHCALLREDTNLDDTLSKFWEIENVEQQVSKSKESQICNEHFNKNHFRDTSGRYVVKMPLKDEPCVLGKSKDIAIKRLNSLWYRLKKDPEYLELYRNFLSEYEKLGHMRQIEDTGETEGTYYIPHVGVFRPGHVSTPLRVCWDASQQTSNGTSLNSLQYNGGMIQEDLFTIMTRFRQYVYAFTADIQKMYRAIRIHPDQTQLLRILWKDEVNSDIKTFELTTVSYGTVSAPYLAQRTLHQLAQDEGKQYPLAEPVLINNFYMDDVLCGADNLELAKEIQSQVTGILRSCGMQLHKWCANFELDNNSGDYKFDEFSVSKALGVSWMPKIDKLAVQVTLTHETEFTKRSVLSVIARLFDPLGLCGPIITKAKIFLQTLWVLKIAWHDHLPEKEAKQWQTFIASLPAINNIKVDRCIITESATTVELHGFCDASEAAYGAVIYCKSKSTSGEVSIQLVASKSRVSPLKKQTIPRLELSAAVLLAKLLNRVVTALKLEISSVLLWSDSMIVLSWLRKEPFKLKTFVSNRVAKIQELTDVQQWRFVPTGENPADLISRGVNAEKLLQSELWWKGPLFLTTDEYPNREIPVAENVNDLCSEFKNCDSNFCMLNLEVKTFIDKLLNITNNYSKLIRICSFILRFINNAKKPINKSTGHLSSKEMKYASNVLVRLVQHESFSEEICELSKGKHVSKKSKLRDLNVFIDNNQLIRVGGRLRHAEISYNQKYPIVLPAKHKLTVIIVSYFHIKNMHVGAQALLCYIRQEFWPLNGRNICKTVVHNCVICVRSKPVTINQIMGDLPKDRVNQTFPFNHSGVDFCGPFNIKYKNQRKGIFHKIYVALFVCFTTRAVHLEVVSDLTSDSFIATLKRFFSRRGKCARLFSDNGLNFVGANSEIKRLCKMVRHPDEALAGFLADEGIDWHFLPPRAPSQGGLWEAGVKSFKHHLKRAMGDAKFTYEEFVTVTTQVEGILNSRPITPLSCDGGEFEVLTPAHFLIGRPVNAMVEPELIDLNDNRLSRWQRTTKIVQNIWKKWQRDYLSNMQQRSKWMFSKDNVPVGAIVLIKEDNLAVCKWLLGKIIQVFPGKDDKVRVVLIKTPHGNLKRPISKICILPVNP